MYVCYRTDLSDACSLLFTPYEVQHLYVPVAPLRANRWQGHLPVASQALSALLERAGRGGMQFSGPERALFTACEFWVAVETRTLVAYLGPDAADALRSLSIIYAAAGAHHIAGMLMAGIAEIGDAATPSDRLPRLLALQERVARTQDPVDELIAGLAHSLGLSAVPRPYREVASGVELTATASLRGRRRRLPRVWWALNP